MVTVIPIVLKSPGTAAPTDTATISSPATPAKAKPAPASIIEEDGLDAPVSNRAKSKTTTTTSELDDVSETDSTTSTSKTASTRSSRTRDYPDGVRTEADKFADDIADAVRDGVFKLVQDDPALMKTLRDKWQENQDFFKNPGENFEEIHRTFQRRYKRSRFVRFMFNNFFENRFVNFFPAGFQGPIRDVIDWLKKPTSSYSSRYDF
jgi:protein required for attachment to host cells